ncbi:MAG: hypothetical protein JO152_08735 [Mycobacteriaceae bacterium]|nr:hypothetical protein [Mycobacteriaceae bacterium]
MRAPDNVAASHLTDVPYVHLFTLDEDELSAEEQAYLAAGRRWQMTEGAYALEQATKPHTRGGARRLADGTAGVDRREAAVVSDCNDDVESAFPRDDLLTWVTIYWVTGTIGTSFSSYVERSDLVDAVATPTGVTLFPRSGARAAVVRRTVLQRLGMGRGAMRRALLRLGGTAAVRRRATRGSCAAGAVTASVSWFDTLGQ